MADIINFDDLVFKIIGGFQKKGSTLGQLPFKFGSLANPLKSES
jgi:hypothetical protein